MSRQTRAIQAPEELPEDELDRSLRPRRLEDFVGQEALKDQLAVSIEAAASRGEALDHVLLAGPPGLGKTSLAQIVAAELDVPFVQTAGPGARAQGRRRRVPDRARAALGVLRRRDPPAAARARGDVLPGDGGPLPADHRRPGRRRADRDDRPAAVHADRRDDADRPADDAAARPLRDPAPPRALRGRGSRADRPPLRAAARASRSRTAARSRSRARSRGTPRVANRLLKRVRDYAEVRHERRRHRRGRRGRARPARGRPRGPRPARPRDPARDLREVRAAARSASRRSRSRSARSRTRSRTCTSRTCSSAGLIERTPRGRAATRRAYEHLGLEPPGPLSLL